MEEEIKEQNHYVVCPMSGRRVPEAACSRKIEKGICVKERDGTCPMKGKKRDLSHEKLIATVNGENGEKKGGETEMKKKAKKVVAKKAVKPSKKAEKKTFKAEPKKMLQAKVKAVKGMPAIPSLKNFMIGACTKSSEPLGVVQLLEILKGEQPSRISYKIKKYGSEAEAIIRLKREISSLGNANSEIFRKTEVNGHLAFGIIPK